MFPQDPIAQAIAGIKQIDTLGYINYFIPISQMVEVTGVWVAGMVTAKICMFIFNICKGKV